MHSEARRGGGGSRVARLISVDPHEGEKGSQLGGGGR
jgi:hypothetical protein